ncbi:MAG: hypothetical protein MZV64_72380 [Ignavibacteriales bacterium]|nr:hypothetical protein [Ignavibacteriales bacterium]
MSPAPPQALLLPRPRVPAAGPDRHLRREPGVLPSLQARALRRRRLRLRRASASSPASAPPALLGTWIGSRLLGRVSERVFRAGSSRASSPSSRCASCSWTGSACSDARTAGGLESTSRGRPHLSPVDSGRRSVDQGDGVDGRREPSIGEHPAASELARAAALTRVANGAAHALAEALGALLAEAQLLHDARKEDPEIDEACLAIREGPGRMRPHRAAPRRPAIRVRRTPRGAARARAARRPSTSAACSSMRRRSREHALSRREHARAGGAGRRAFVAHARSPVAVRVAAPPRGGCTRSPWSRAVPRISRCGCLATPRSRRWRSRWWCRAPRSWRERRDPPPARTAGAKAME